MSATNAGATAGSPSPSTGRYPSSASYTKYEAYAVAQSSGASVNNVYLNFLDF